MTQNKLWTNEDLDNALQYVKTRPYLAEQLLEDINVLDRGAVRNIIADGWAEAFDRYDSDVAEQFIRAYEKLLGE